MSFRFDLFAAASGRAIDLLPLLRYHDGTHDGISGG